MAFPWAALSALKKAVPLVRSSVAPSVERWGHRRAEMMAAHSVGRRGENSAAMWVHWRVADWVEHWVAQKASRKADCSEAQRADL